MGVVKAQRNFRLVAEDKVVPPWSRTLLVGPRGLPLCTLCMLIPLQKFLNPNVAQPTKHTTHML